MLAITHRARRLGWRFGYDVRPFAPMRDPFLRLAGLLEGLGCSTLLDVGANDGQWAEDVREAGFGGEIVSFEPDPEPFVVLEARAGCDGRWTAHRMGLGAESGSRLLHHAGDSHFNSLLSSHLAESAETVRVERLDEVMDPSAAPMFLKIDVQGYELSVLEGASGILDQIAGISVEAILRPLYEGQPTMLDLLVALDGCGFRVAGVVNGTVLPNGRETAFDLLAVRS